MIAEESVQKALKIVEDRMDIQPSIGLVLGSGLGGLIEQIGNMRVLPFDEIPCFPRPSVKGHQGNLVWGNLGNKQVIALQGRVHYYESRSMDQVAFPIRILRKTGIEKLILTNACGAINPDFSLGSFMFIRDHINWMGSNPLIGPNREEWGPRFPEMRDAYDPGLIEIGLRSAQSTGLETFSGIYCGVRGPNYLSRAELKMLRFFGADTVGMSTVPETIAARHMNLPVLGISCITDMAVPETLTPLTHEDVIRVAEEAGPAFVRLITTILERL